MWYYLGGGRCDSFHVKMLILSVFVRFYFFQILISRLLLLMFPLSRCMCMHPLYSPSLHSISIMNMNCNFNYNSNINLNINATADTTTTSLSHHCMLYHCSVHDRCILEWIPHINLSVGRLCHSPSPYILPLPLQSQSRRWCYVDGLRLYVALLLWCCVMCHFRSWYRWMKHSGICESDDCAQTETSEMTIMCLLWCWLVFSLSALFCFVFVVGARCKICF